MSIAAGALFPVGVLVDSMLNLVIVEYWGSCGPCIRYVIAKFVFNGAIGSISSNAADSISLIALCHVDYSLRTGNYCA